jgi:hypothetical protein
MRVKDNKKILYLSIVDVEKRLVIVSELVKKAHLSIKMVLLDAQVA